MLHHDAIETISATLAGTNTAKIVDLLEGTFGVDLPTRDDEDDDNEVESITSEEEEHLPKMQELPPTWLPNQLILPNLLNPLIVLLPPSSDLPPRSRAKANNIKMRGQKLTGSLRQNL